MPFGRVDPYFGRKVACGLFDSAPAYDEKRAALSQILYEAFGTGVPPKLLDCYPDWRRHVERRRDAAISAIRARGAGRPTDPRLPKGGKRGGDR